MHEQRRVPKYRGSILMRRRRAERTWGGRLKSQEAIPHGIGVLCVRSQVQVNLKFGDGARQIIFASENFRQQEMDLRETRAHIEAGGFESALFRLFRVAEVDVGDCIVEVSLGV